MSAQATEAPPRAAQASPARTAEMRERFRAGKAALLEHFRDARATALSAGRLRTMVERGPRISRRARLWLAFAGGALMGVAAGLARGCISGQALSGGALLATGSWVFMMMVFAGGYAGAWFVRRQWT